MLQYHQHNSHTRVPVMPDDSPFNPTMLVSSLSSNSRSMRSASFDSRYRRQRTRTIGIIALPSVQNVNQFYRRSRRKRTLKTVPLYEFRVTHITRQRPYQDACRNTFLSHVLQEYENTCNEGLLKVPPSIPTSLTPFTFFLTVAPPS